MKNADRLEVSPIHRNPCLSAVAVAQRDFEIVQMSGDSMFPDFLPGERLVVDPDHRIPSPPGVYVIWDGFGLVVKRLEIVPSSNPVLVRIIPRNHQYQTFERRLCDMDVRGRVVGKWTST